MASKPIVPQEDSKLIDSGPDLDPIKDCVLKSNTSTCFNYVNSVLGSGIIGMAYALEESGVILGLILVTLVAVVVDWSLQVLLAAGLKINAKSYQELVEHALGRPGFWILTICQFGYPMIAMVSYNIVAGDTMTKVLVSVTGWPPTSLLLQREVIITTFTIFFTAPLCFYRNIGNLSKASMSGMVCMAFILTAIFIRLFTMKDQMDRHDSTWSLIDFSGVSKTYGIIIFAFLCHHNSFMMYYDMKIQTQDNWNKVTHISLGLSWAACIFLGFVGYCTFKSWTQGDLLNNYCWDDPLMNIVKVLFCFTVLFTYPIECLVTREVITNLFLNQKDNEPNVAELGMPLYIGLTVGLNLMGLIISISAKCLGVVVAANGVIFGIPLATIVPALCYLKVADGSWFEKYSLASVTILIMGSIAFVFGCYETITQGNNGCVVDVEMPYCRINGTS